MLIDLKLCCNIPAAGESDNTRELKCYADETFLRNDGRAAANRAALADTSAKQQRAFLGYPLAKSANYEIDPLSSALVFT